MIEGLKPLYNNTLRPLARLLGKLGIQPNHITLAGLLFFVIAAWFCSTGEWINALFLVIAGALMDGLDGVLARESGKKSVFGAILDSSCDRLTEIFLLFGVLSYYLHLGEINQTGVILCFTGISGSIMVSYIKARCEGAGIPCKGGLFQRPERIIILSIGLLTGPVGMIWVLSVLTVFSWITVIQRIFEAAQSSRKIQQVYDNQKSVNLPQ